MFERELRDLSFVKRWQILRSNRSQSVAEHSYYVAVYADQIATYFKWQGDRTALLRYALWHDAAEVATGDIPGPVKRRLVDPKRLAALEVEYLTAVFPGNEWVLPDDIEVRAIVSLANCIDEIFWVGTETQMGNNSICGAVPNGSFNRMNLHLNYLVAKKCTDQARAREFTVAVLEAHVSLTEGCSKLILDHGEKHSHDADLDSFKGSM